MHSPGTKMVFSYAAFVAFLSSLDAQAAPTTFDVIASSGLTGGGRGEVLRFSGATGEFLGSFVGPEDGINDPRDIVRDTSPGGDPATYFVNAGNFPPSPKPDNDRVVVVAKDGSVVRTAFDFSETGSGFVDPGGAVFGPNGNYFAGSRAQGTVLEFDPSTGNFVGSVFEPGVIDGGIRGFVFGNDGTLFIGNGANPFTGVGGGGLVAVLPDGTISTLVDADQDPALSPLDVILSPDGDQLVVSSQFPFGDGAAAAATIRTYDIETGELLTVLDPGLDDDGQPLFSAPRGLGFGPDGLLYASSTGNGRILRFDLGTAMFIDVFAEVDGLNGQALEFVDTEPVPLPGALALMALGTGLVGWRCRRQR